jgi:hypothetical protein
MLLAAATMPVTKWTTSVPVTAIIQPSVALRLQSVGELVTFTQQKLHQHQQHANYHPREGEPIAFALLFDDATYRESRHTYRLMQYYAATRGSQQKPNNPLYRSISINLCRYMCLAQPSQGFAA